MVNSTLTKGQSVTAAVKPEVRLLAHTRTTSHVEDLLTPHEGARQMDHLIEVAGRSCYESWDRPNQKTGASVEAYMANILGQGHLSVLEHASATFYVTGVSRSFLAEFTRHRHLNFSVRSQRFVDESQAGFVVPPAIRENLEGGEGDLELVMETAAGIYDTFVDRLRSQGLGRKQAREAARAVMPNMTETRIVVTGNLRAWREMLPKRLAPGADAEIREVCGQILWHLERIAPAAVQGIREEVR